MIELISEQEFIGESLPKINDNFTNLDGRANSLQADMTQYASLSGFYATHSNNANISFQTIVDSPISPNPTFNKQSIFTSNGVDASKVIYPIPVYLTVTHNSTTIDPTVVFRVDTGSGLNVLKSITTNRATTAGINVNHTLTLLDLGYQNFTLQCTSSGGVFSLVMALKLFN